MTDPVVPLERHLHEHLVAVFFFFLKKKKSEHTLAEVLLEDGWERVPGWESKKWLLVDVDVFFFNGGHAE